MNKPYAERYRLLRTTFQEIRGTFMFPAQEKIRDAAHFAECFNKAHDANEEGVVIKQSTSMYRPGQREKGGWIKIKPDVSFCVTISKMSPQINAFHLFDFDF